METSSDQSFNDPINIYGLSWFIIEALLGFGTEMLKDAMVRQ